jgi:uncharacterized membrane protein
LENVFMKADKIQKTREDLVSSLWLVPSVFAIVAIALSFILPEIDNWVEQDLEPYRAWIFFGSASAARTVLQVIAGSLITVISVVFSITILTLHQASAQYTPRIIRTFMADRTNQGVLGIYIATFLYSVLIIRRIRGEDAPGDESIPMLSVTLSILLAVVCLMVLVYFIHHIAREFQPATVIGRVHKDLLRQIDTMYPEMIGDPMEQADDDLDSFRETHGRGQPRIVTANTSGYIRMIEESVLPGTLEHGESAAVLPQVGSYVIHGQALLEVSGSGGPLDPREDRFREAFLIDEERTMAQDALFGVRQLADIALKGLSPSIHDPTTSEQAISALGDGLACLAQRSFPSRVRVIAKGDDDDEDALTHIALWANRPSWEEFVDEAYSQIRQVAQDNVHVTLYLLDTLQRIAGSAPAGRTAALQIQVDEVLWHLDHSDLSPRNQMLIRESAEGALRAMRKPISPVASDNR